MIFRNPSRNKTVFRKISEALNNKETNDVNQTGILYGAINNNPQYQNQEEAPAEEKENPSVTGTFNTAKSIKGYIGGGSGGSGGGGTPWGAIASGVKTGYDTIFDKKDENGYDDYSDMEEAIIYPLQGAAAGSSFGPWGALGGALYGLGYSFKDDLGLEDNEWYTDLLFPIGMGDEHQGLGLNL